MNHKRIKKFSLESIHSSEKFYLHRDVSLFNPILYPGGIFL